MDQETLSFWADIGKYEETLAKDPSSFCFAPLADLYRKLGMIDEAIAVAKKGCDRHPGYVGGFMALGRAYYEKGMKEESRAALEKVIAATPENHLAQKLLSQLYLETGDKPAAEQSLQIVLSANPDDKESRYLLDALRSGNDSPASVAAESSAGIPLQVDADGVQGTALEYELSLDEAEVIEDLTDEIVDLHEEHDAQGLSLSTGMDSDPDRKDPLKTATLAELYVSQGFLSSALSIYQELLKNDPDNKDYERRLSQIRQSIVLQEQEEQGVVEDLPAGLGEQPPVAVFAQQVEAGSGGSAPLVALEKWLENIQRRR
ncbi:tetratricopeptide repeat protein [Geotalea sp. SG265]|uniref:tetratricopeptide repeat protein n=1 Tax=Geotalea sp. SG265 TaxID=2922867 RepID=UPI001FB04560|nr:tetratricopeptide repeat protein [Geotalea sp. SG265]